MKYRQKPIEVEVFRYDGDFKDSNGEYRVPDWAAEAHKDGNLYYDEDKRRSSRLLVQTVNGWICVSIGDYMIKDKLGAIYPCKQRVFEYMYEAVESEGK